MIFFYIEQIKLVKKYKKCKCYLIKQILYGTNSENTKTSDPRRILHNFADDINLKGNGKYVAVSLRGTENKVN